MPMPAHGEIPQPIPAPIVPAPVPAPELITKPAPEPAPSGGYFGTPIDLFPSTSDYGDALETAPSAQQAPNIENVS